MQKDRKRLQRQWFNLLTCNLTEARGEKQEEQQADQFYEWLQKKRSQELVVQIWDEFKLLRLYNKARIFRAFILQKTVLKSLVKNIKVQKDLKKHKIIQEEKIKYMILQRYFTYLKTDYTNRQKHIFMAKYVYQKQLKQKIFYQLIKNTRAKPITKLKKASWFYQQTLLQKGLTSLSIHVKNQSLKYQAQFKAQNREIADLMYSSKAMATKELVFRAWVKSTQKKLRKRRRKERIQLKEAFYQWKLYMRMVNEYHKMQVYN